jgi:hypothetical protein
VTPKRGKGDNMAVLLSVHTSEGCVGRCDAKCYNAQSTTCACVCGGKNHGAGFQVAFENTEKFAAEWVKQYAKEHRFEVTHFEDMTAEPVQTSLFPSLVEPRRVKSTDDTDHTYIVPKH